MNNVNYIELFNRHKEKKIVLDFLESYSNTDNTKRSGLYILGPIGSGKTQFVKDVIPTHKYDVIVYNSNDIRTKNNISNIIGSSLSDVNVIQLFSKKRKPIVIVMDEMDYMTSGDKGGIKELIKLIRIKKTKKHNKDPQTCCPIIFIGTNDNDKKIKELVDCCVFLPLMPPTPHQMLNYINLMMPKITNKIHIDKLLEYLGGNMHRIKLIINLYNTHSGDINIVLDTVIHKYNYHSHTKYIIKKLYDNYIPISQYDHIIKETDRTTLGLLWHENVAPIITTTNNLKLYKNILDIFCTSDYIDRLIFQFQIWQLSEQNSIVKLFYNNYLLHTNVKQIKPREIIFTKVLTKYSTEYNNFCFIQQLEQKMFCSNNDIINLFITKSDEDLIYKYYLNKLDVARMRRFIVNGSFTSV